MHKNIDKIIKSFSPKQFILFLIFSGIAAVVNLGSRILFNIYIPSYISSIILAYICGMATAFILNKYLNFKGKNKKIRLEFTNFALVNLIGLAETLIISLLMISIILPFFNIINNTRLISHMFGVASPVITSFLGHKYITFGKYGFKDIISYAVNKFKS